MKVRCDYCESFFDENLAKCPSCGASNDHIKRTSSDIPKTIDELKAWYVAHHLPDENVTRFFIGKDYKGAKAFGIYRDGEEVIVYKNKADGSRAVRYQGKDEAYAVNELYMKLKEVIAEQKSNNSGRSKGSNKKKNKIEALKENFYIVIIVVLIIGAAINAVNSPSNGYYKYNGDTYYYHSNWYRYSDYSGWDMVDAPDELDENYKEYYKSSYYSSDIDATNIENTDWAASWDDDSDWDSSDSWDSGGGTDWDSDW